MHQQKGLHVPDRHRVQEYTGDVNPCWALMTYTSAGEKNLEKTHKFLGGGKSLPVGNQGFGLFCFLLKGGAIKRGCHWRTFMGGSGRTQQDLFPVAEDNSAPRDDARAARICQAALPRETCAGYWKVPQWKRHQNNHKVEAEARYIQTKNKTSIFKNESFFFWGINWEDCPSSSADAFRCLFEIAFWPAIQTTGIILGESWVQ